MNEYETVTNGSEHETRSRHVEMNEYETNGNEMNEYETVTNGNEHETRYRM